MWLVAGAGAQTPISPVESPAASGFFNACPTGTLSGLNSGNGHVYSFEAEAGDQVTVWVDGDAGSYPRVRIRNVGGTNLASTDGNVFGLAAIQAFEIPAPGTYTVLVYSDHVAMDYAMRFDLGRGVDLESEGNDEINLADLLQQSGFTSPFTLRMAGALEHVDVFELGTLNAGNSLSLGLLRPASSTLLAGDAILTLRKEDGSAVATSATESLNFTVVDDGAYFLEVGLANLSGETLIFDGSNDSVALGNPAELQIVGDTTVEFWIKPDADSFNARRNPWAKAYGGEGTFTLEPDGVMNYYYGNGGGNSASGTYQGFGTVKPLLGGQWNHVALVRRLDSAPQKLFFYLNGELVNEADATFFPAVASALNAFIGQGYVSPFKGEMDEVKVWNVVRSQAEVQADMAAAAVGNEAGLVGYWKFEDRTVDPLVATDETANGLDGTVVGTPEWGGAAGSETFAASRGGRKGLYLIEATVTDGEVPTVVAVEPTAVDGHIFPGTTYAPYSVSNGGLRGNNGVTYQFTVTGSTGGSIWGTDIYTDDSSIAKAAVHMGLLEPGESGPIAVTVLADVGSYPASTRNGVSSGSYGAYAGAFTLAAGTVIPPYDGLYSSAKVRFSESLDSSSAADVANYEVRGAGENGVFDDSDDVLYPISSASYNGETAVRVSFDGAPLQPGAVRIRVGTGVRDRAGNALVAAHDFTFTVAQVAGYVTEQGSSNGYFGSAVLGMTGGAAQAGDGIWTYTTATGDRPLRVELLHADADGVLDLVVLDEYGDDVQVHLGVGDGSFGAGTSYPVGDRPLDMAVVDFDNNGLLDVVVPVFNSDVLARLQNNGDGTFTALASVGLADGPLHVAVGQFNGDSFPDLAVTHFNNGNGGYHISVLTGDGASGFTEVEVGQGLSPVQRPYGIAVGDFDGVNGDDFAIGDYNNKRVQVYLNDGAGGFSAPVPYQVDASEVYALVAADLDKDGAVDLVAAGTYRDRVSVMLGNGDGTFGAYSEVVVGWNQEYYNLVVEDFDGDGNLDLFLPGTSDLGFAQGRGDGTFESVLRYNSIDQAQGVAVGDVNGDGLKDFVMTRVDYDQVLTFLGQPVNPLFVDGVDGRAAHGFGRGFISDTGDYDYFQFSAEAGQRLVVAYENPVAFGSSGLRFRVMDAATNVYVTDYGESTGNRGETNQVTIPYTGNFFVEVFYNYQYWGEYRFRATLLDAPISIESENNNSIGNADGVPLALGVGELTGTVSGYISWGGSDSSQGDYYSVGNLGEGTQLTLDMTVPGISSLVPVMRIYRGSTEVAVSTAGDAQLSYTVGVGEADTYRFSVHQDGGTAGMSSVYLVDVTAADLVAPLVTANNLPAEGSSGGFPGPNFTVTFSEDMLASTVNDLGHYELLGSGGDGTFGDGNEVAYSLIIPSAYGSGLNVGLRIVDGPLQADDYRFRVTTGLRDKTNNPLGVEHVRLFSVVDEAGFLTEGRSNDSFGEAEPLSVAGEAAGFDRSFYRRYTTGSGIDSPHSPKLLHLDDTGAPGTADDVLDLVVVNHDTHDIAVALGNGDGTFGTATNYPTGSRPIYLTLIDFDGDGDDDVVVESRDSDRVDVFENPLDGTLANVGSLTVGDGPHQIVAGDFDHADGLDFAVANYYTNVGAGGRTVSVMFGDGAGGFTEVRVEPPGGSPSFRPYSLAAADVNKDGWDDLLVGDWDTDDVVVFLNDQAGGFPTASYLPLPDSEPSSIRVADMDNDGNVDLVVTNEYHNAYSVLRGNGDGTFEPYQEIGLGANSYQYFHELRDLDGDGLADILVARDNGLFVTYNRTSAPGPISVTGGSLYGEVSGGRGLDIGDVNNDGRPDVVVGAAYQNLVHVYLGNGPVELAVDAIDARMRHVYARGNLTDSNDWDYYRFTASYGERIVVVSEGPPGASSAGRFYTLYYPGGSQVLTMGANSQGVGTSSPYFVSVPGTYYLRVSQNYFSDWEYRFRVSVLSPGVQYETENNVNLGNADSLAFDVGAGTLSASVAGYLPTDDSGGIDIFLLGNLSPGNEITLDFTAPELSALAAVLQVRRSDNSVVAASAAGDPQLAFTVVDADTYYFAVSGNPKGIYSQYLVDISIGDSVAPTVAGVNLPAEGTTASYVGPAFTVTFSEDMLASTVTDAANYDLRGAGEDGTFETGDDEIYTVVPRSYSSGLNAVFDVPDGPLQPGMLRFTVGTGLTDKLSLPLAAPYVRMFGVEEVVGFVGESRSNDTIATADVLTAATPSGVFDGGFTHVFSATPGDYPVAVELEDLDGDGHLDAVVANLNGGNVVVMPGDGTGAFGAPTSYPTGNDAVRMLAFDWNKDGRRDFVVSNRYEDRVYLFQNAGDGTLAPLGTIAVGDNPLGMAWGDFDGDGNPDFVVGNWGTNGTTGRAVSVLLGDGTGAFVHSLVEQGQMRVHNVAVADFDGNGLDDIAATDYDSDDLRILLATGGGAFAPPVSIDIDDEDHSYVETADFNQDGAVDLVVVGEYDNNVSILEGNGDGTFQTPWTLGFATGNTYQWFIGTEDINGDGWPDLAVGRDNGLDLRYNRPGAEIAFDSPQWFDDYGKVEGFAVGDVNEDGRPDLMLTAPNADRLYTLLGNGGLPLADDSGEPGLEQGYGRGYVRDSSDVDFWKYSGEAGQRVFIATETLGNAGGSGKHYQFLDGQGQVLANYYGASTGQVHGGVTLPYDGTFYLRVGNNNQSNHEYRFALTIFENSTQYESESNNSTNQADGLGFSLNAGTREAKVFGVVHSNDGNGDYFDLGGLAEGTQISLSLGTPGPERSTLDPFLYLYDSSGTLKASGAQGDRTLSYTVGAGEDGTFYARINSAARDMFARYLMTVRLTDTLPPEITATSLPAEGATTLGLVEGFTLTTNEDLLASTVNDLANYELVEAGVDGVFGSSDDVVSVLAVSNYTSGQTISISITDGPLVPGIYRFTASDSITDTFGAALIADFVRLFEVGQVPGFTTGLAGNDTPGTATPLVFVEDPTGLLTGAGRGRIVSGSDRDYWVFPGVAGEVFTLDTDLLGAPVSYNLYWRLVTPGGSELFLTNYGRDDWGRFVPIVLPETGDYVFDVRHWHSFTGEYQFRISRVPVFDVETEINGAISSSDALTLTNVGGVDSGSGVGFIESTGDLDYYSLGTIDAGKTVFLNVLLPATSDFNPVVSLYNSGGQLMPESNGSLGDGTAEVPISVTADYHLLVRNSGLTPTDLMDQYVVTVQILDTALVNFPNLQVTDVALPPQVGLQSGDGITFSFEVSNVGTDGTGVSSWVDRAVMSRDQTYGNADDIEVAFETRSGALAQGASYTVNAAATIPDGVVGDYYLLVRTDLNNQVDELYLEGDNTAVSGGTFPVSLRAYPDLVVENLTVTPPAGAGDWMLDWNLANRGSAAAPGGTKERVRVVNSTTGVVALDVTRTVVDGLAVDGTEARSAAVSSTAAGNYLVTVTVDAEDDLFEHNGTSHGVAEVNAFTTSYQILQYWDITVAPSDPAHGTVQIGAGGTSVSVLNGASVTVTATPDTSVLPYQFAQWRTAGGAFLSAQASYTFSATADRDLVAVFQLPTYQVTATVSPAGAGSVSGTGSFAYNATANLTATPAAGYLFGHWQEGGSNISSNASLALTVTADRALTAIFEEANPSHDVTTATSPAGLAVVTGAGTYTNGQVANIVAPASVIDGGTEYLFEKFELNGTHFGTSRSITKTFSTLDAPTMAFVARYTSRPLNPVVASVGINYPPPVPAANNVVFTLFFDRPMDTGTDPVLALSSVNASSVPTVPAGGTWLSATSFESMPVVFGAGNNGSFTLAASVAVDTNGRTMDPANVFGFEADTIAPANPVLALATSDGNSATVEWSGYAAPVDLNGFRMFRLGSDFGSVTGLQPVTSVGKAVRSFRFTGLTPDTDYFVAAQAVDVAGNASPAVTTLRVFLDSDVPPAVPFTVTATGPDTALVDWSAFDATGLVGFEGFQVFAETSTFNDVAALTPVETLGAGETSVELDGLDRGETYSIAVVGYNRLGERDTAVVPLTWTDPLRGTVTQDLSIGTPGGTETVDVFEDVVIGGGATLTILPGTTMRFAAGTSLTIENGILDAQGTKLLPINLTSVADVPGGSPQRGDWDGLILEDGTNHSTLRHLWVRYGKGLQLVDAQPVLDGFYAVWNAGQGLKASGGAMVGTVGAYLALNDLGVLAEGTSMVAMSGSVLKNHTVADVQQTGGAVVDVSGNWWGSASVGTVLGTATSTGPLATEPVLYGVAATANGVTSTSNPTLALKLASPNAVAYRLSENSGFPGVLFRDIFPPSTTNLYSPRAFDASFNLSAGGGLKTVYAQFQSVTGEVTTPVALDITFITNGPSINGFNLADGQVVTRPLQVTGSGSAPLGVKRVQFYAGGVLVSNTPSASLSFRWDMRALPVGPIATRLVVEDNSGAQVSRTVNVVLSPLPPPKPVITSHANGAVVAGGTLNLAGTAEPFIGLRVSRNGTIQGTGLADAAGNFLITNVGLVEGYNDLRVVAYDNLGSTSSNVVRVEADSGPPVTPVLAVGAYTPGRGLRLTWTTPDSGEQPSRFRVFWHGSAFANPAAASGMSPFLTLFEYNLKTAPDGVTHIGVVGYDQAGNASPLSNLEVVTVDQTAPAASIAYDRAMPVGPGNLGIVLNTSEPLQGNPLLTIRPAGGSTLSVPLTKTSGTTYSATYPVNSLTALSGQALVRVTMKDLAGNTQTVSPTGEALVFDVTKPTGAIAFGAVPPIGTSGGNETVSFSLTLSEAAAAGTTPTLMFTPPIGAALNPVLTGSGTNWSGQVTLTVAMGNGDGLFNLSAQDAAGNVGTVITQGEKLEVYNTAEPSPPGVPVLADFYSQSGGRFFMDWNPVSRAESYSIYREPGSAGAAPTVLLVDGLTATEYTDSSQPADGEYRYVVTASRRGVEGAASGIVPGLSDSTPPEKPENFTAVLTDQGVVIGFSAPSTGENPRRYVVYRNGVAIRHYNTPRSTTDRPPKGLHEYRVASVDPYDNENPTAPIAIELFVDAVTNLDVAVTPGAANTLTWDSSDPAAVGYNFYRNGVKQNAAPIPTKFYQDLVPNPPTEPLRYSVTAVNAAAKESAKKSVTVFPLEMTLTLNPDVDGVGRASVEQYFDVFRVSVRNKAAAAAGSMAWGSFQVQREIGAETDQFGLTVGADILGGTTVVRDLVVPSPQTPGIDQRLDVTLVQTFEGQDSTVSYGFERTQLPAVTPPVMVAVTTPDTPLAGGLTDVEATIYNRGFAAMDVVLVTNGGSDAGDVYCSVQTPGGVEMQRVDFDGPVGGLTFAANGDGYVTLEPGQSKKITIPQVLIPEVLADAGGAKIVVVASKVYHRRGMAGEQLSGPISGAINTGLVETPYYATSMSSHAIYSGGGGPITITGMAKERAGDTPEADAELKLGFSAGGAVWYEPITADASGNFSHDFTPLEGFSGELKVWAAHPDVFDQLNQVSILVYRVYVTPGTGEIRMSKNDTLDFTLNLVNPGSLNLTGVAATFRAFTVDGGGAETDIGTITGSLLTGSGSGLQAKETKNIKVQLQAAVDAPDEAMIEVTLATAEGASATFLASLVLSEPIPILSVVSPSVGYVQVSLDRGDVISRELVITNRGLRALEGVTITPPQNIDWFQINLPQDPDGKIRLPDLPVGGTLRFGVVFTPSEAVAQGDYSDIVRINGSNSPQNWDLNLYSRVTSDLTGDVHFYVDNILVQPVPNASIRIRNLTTGAEFGPFNTDVNGEYTVTGLMEGDWTWKISASGHSTAAGVVKVLPDQTAEVEQRLDKSLVTVNFTVVPVPYTDRYEIKLEQTFETHVPAPVLVQTPASVNLTMSEDNNEATVLFTVKNEGLISLFDVEIRGVSNDEVSMTPLVNYLPELRAQQSIQVPAVVKYHGGGAAETGGFIDTANNIYDCYKNFKFGNVRLVFLATDGNYSCADGARSNTRVTSTVNINVDDVIDFFCDGITGKILGKIKYVDWGCKIVNIIKAIGCVAVNLPPGRIGGGGGGGGFGGFGGFGGGGIPYTGGIRFCLTGDTPVRMADGSELPIRDVAEGDRIYANAYTGATAEVTARTERVVDSGVYTVTAARGDGRLTKLEVTGEHRIWVDGSGWKAVKSLEVGEWLEGVDNEVLEVRSIEPLAGEHTVYSLIIGGESSFYAGGVLVEEGCGDAEDPVLKEVLRRLNDPDADDCCDGRRRGAVLQTSDETSEGGALQ